MDNISRRKFLAILSSLSLSYPLTVIAASSGKNNQKTNSEFPITKAVLKSAYEAEKMAYENYVCFSQKAVEDAYPNIAYLFTAFAMSEKIHADNYRRILASMRTGPKEPEIEVIILDTKKNLIKATEGELKKIEKTYPDFIGKLKAESHDQAVINCMYSWKSHQQHTRKINEIHKYSKYFFGHVAQKIEGLKLDFHICEICGSTIDEAPRTPCDICNMPHTHYSKVNRPA
ncbi:MAG: ferritin family protein [Desulfobacterales bacterium]|jgi:rubrerythrin